jgi:hypothetical protein
MLTYRVYRTSTFLTGHRPENELSYMDAKVRHDSETSVDNWYIDFSTLEELMKFAAEHGKLIIKPPTYKGTVGDIEIYDSPREGMYIEEIIN